MPITDAIWPAILFAIALLCFVVPEHVPSWFIGLVLLWASLSEMLGAMLHFELRELIYQLKRSNRADH